MMGSLLPSCFPSKKAKKPQLQAMASERKVEYATNIGRVIVTWSRAITGLSLFTQIDLSNNAATTSSASTDPSPNLTNDQHGPFFDFRISPSLPVQRRGLRRYKLYGRGITRARQLEFAWDFTNVQFHVSGDVQPMSGYYFCIAVEGEMVLLLGDMKEEAYNHVKARKSRSTAIPVSREETVNLKGCTYSTKVFLGGEEMDFAVNFMRRMEDSMTVWIDGRKVVKVETKWRKFDGSREVGVPGGVIGIVWDRLEWTNRECTTRCSAAREFAIARLAISYTQEGGGGSNVGKSFCLNLFR